MTHITLGRYTQYISIRMGYVGFHLANQLGLYMYRNPHNDTHHTRKIYPVHIFHDSFFIPEVNIY